MKLCTYLSEASQYYLAALILQSHGTVLAAACF